MKTIIQRLKHFLIDTPWTQKTTLQRLTTITSFIGISLAIGILAFALSRLFDTKVIDVEMGKGRTLTVNIVDTVPKRDLVPGDEVTVNPTVSNDGTEVMYLYVRFDCSTYTNPSNSSVEPIYSFSPDESVSSSWYHVPSSTGEEGQIIMAYGAESEMTPVAHGESVSLPGKLTLVMDNDSFNGIDAEGLDFKIVGCGIDTAGEVSARGAYDEYLELSGQ